MRTDVLPVDADRLLWLRRALLCCKQTRLRRVRRFYRWLVEVALNGCLIHETNGLFILEFVFLMTVEYL
jgi:hypothetical protein